ncbi:hypothetical protein [Streptacidiphilus fuscans]|uniref:PEGA domain-containing protein n=1 Tax=Streptacidiphilus fuscans TaxID=2789292 RepID=A0A931B2A1_9ACTN|nr:hypothetical protein [Streptacidiphilus fuscans]MBF9068951.1 hypothetical protein [Streptacidiphilus fuscans]MBF9073405.1 hypothetical protein [Streptacidiphilus fuscans]
MAGEMVIRAEAPPLRTASVLGVLVDGERVGEVKQGSLARFPLDAGSHTVRVTAKGGRSNDVVIEMPEEGAYRVQVTSTGMSLLVGILPFLYVVFGFVPGLLMRVVAQGVVAEGTPSQAAAEAVDPGEAAPNGLWWQADPKLAKRFQS